MVLLPLITRLRVKNYGLFPGTHSRVGIDKTIEQGLTLIAGINGLGKTTLLNTILRAITGPYDLSGDGVPGEMGITIPQKPVELRKKALDYFRQRVADGARNARVHLTACFGQRELTIVRRMDNLSLIEFQIDGRRCSGTGNRAAEEGKYQNALTELMGLSSFVDVLLILHHVVFFPEDRPGALWNTNTQRHILRALFLDRDDASRVADLERLVQSADSQARNIQTRITATKKELSIALQAEEGVEAVSARLEAEQRLLDADLEEKNRLEELHASLEEERRTIRLEHERAKIEHEEAAGAVERLKYSALATLYPNMNEASRLVIARILTEDKCLVCDATARRRRKELESLLEKGICPACGTPPEEQQNVAGKYEFEQARLDLTRERVHIARDEEDFKGNQLAQITQSYDDTVSRLTALEQSVRDRRERHKHLRAQLPSSTTSKEIEHALLTLQRQHKEWKSKLAIHVQHLAELLEKKEEVIKAQGTTVINNFSELAEGLLAETARLAEVNLSPRYTQARGAEAGKRLQFPAYHAEMIAANRPGFVRRSDPSDVSESQLELIDLAFRLALVRAATPCSAATFVMETPEASLDGLAMERVGKALSVFAATAENRLIVTSNLSNSGVITSLFGGPLKSEQDIEDRHRRLLNLLYIAAPNHALEQNRSKYEKLLVEAVEGRT